jgi:hypothetical protein
MCKHQPQCPDAMAPDRTAARVTVSHPEQGWSLLCNGVVLFDDAGTLLPGVRKVTSAAMAWTAAGPALAAVPLLAA